MSRFIPVMDARSMPFRHSEPLFMIWAMKLRARRERPCEKRRRERMQYAPTPPRPQDIRLGSIAASGGGNERNGGTDHPAKLE
jgi:hypothetical protein